MKFKKKPVVIDAIQYTGHNEYAVLDWMHGFDGAFAAAVVDGELKINTLEGQMTVSPGDWVIRGVEGEFYPCKPDIFKKTYTRHHDHPYTEKTVVGYSESYSCCAVCGAYTHE